jgi:hypothetical protein
MDKNNSYSSGEDDYGYIRHLYSPEEIEDLKVKAVNDFKEQYGIVLVQTTIVKAVVTK